MALLVVAACSTRRTPGDVVDTTAIERAVDGVTDSVAAAVARKDVTRLDELMRSAQYIGSGLVIPPGRFAAMAGPAFSQLAMIQLTWTSREVRVLTPRVALMTARAVTISGDTSGSAAREEGLYTMVFVEDAKGVWRLASVHKTT
jgi:uncharacterized protein (TIGR02246 family)